MASILVDNITYTFTQHALRRMNEEPLTVAQVEEVMSDPDRVEVSKSSGRTVYIKAMRQPKGTVLVAVEEHQIIVTAYWLRRPR